MYYKTIEILKEHNIKVISTEENFDKNDIKLECYCGKQYVLTFSKIKVLKHKCCKSCFSSKMGLLRSEILRKKNVKDTLAQKGFIILGGEYINQGSIFRFRCSCCNVEFERSVGQALHSTTMCRKCSNFDSSYDDNTRINELKRRGVVVLEYISKDIIITECKICRDPIQSAYEYCLNGRKCKLCLTAFTPLSISEVERNLPENVTWISGVYKNQRSIINVKCNCGQEFNASVASLYGSTFGCKKCSQKQRTITHRRTMESKEIWTEAKEIADKHKYNVLVDKYTKMAISQSDILDGVALGICGSGMYQVDHMFSKFYGFKYNILPHIIGSIHNLAVITEKENSSKGRKCSITLDELFFRFFNKE